MHNHTQHLQLHHMRKHIINNNVEQQINNMQQQINSLENRVAKLESKSNTTTYNNKYSDSNYYML